MIDSIRLIRLKCSTPELWTESRADEIQTVSDAIRLTRLLEVGKTEPVPPLRILHYIDYWVYVL
jgi:hypothetical protein